MDEQTPNKSEHRDNRAVTGIAFLVVGRLLLANKMKAGVPDWVFTWPSILIMVGIYSAFKDRFRNGWWLIFIAVGALFLVNNQFLDLNIEQYTLPIVFIAVGLMFILRPRHKWRGEEHWKKHQWKHNRFNNYNPSPEPNADSINNSDGEFIEMNAVFGGGKKIIFSKNFKGGEINCFMGGAEIDLTQADIQGPVVIEAHQVFGGTKIIIPPHWDVKAEITSVFAGLDDKRPPVATKIDPSKVLILKGVSIFAGIEIKSY